MFKQLYQILTSDPPLEEASRDFNAMLAETQAMVLEASQVYWGRETSPEERTALYKRDVLVNKHQRAIRRSVISHLTGGETRALSFSLKLMSLVKDVERLGDYAKNLTEVQDLAGSSADHAPHQMEGDKVIDELREIAHSVEALAQETPAAFETGNTETATQLTVTGRSMAKRCDKLVSKIAAGDYPTDTAVNLTLATRFYKRIQAHYLNILSAVLMPLDKLDYFDEDAVGR